MKAMTAAILGALLLVAAPVLADETGREQCARAFDQCLAACDEEFGEDTAGRAACVPKCSGKYAACDAGVAYEKAKPWLEEQAEKTKRFLDELMEDLKKDPPESDPQSPDKSI